MIYQTLILLILFMPNLINAQSIDLEAVATGGDQFKSNLLTLDWTLGEIAVETMSRDEVKLTQGFQQGSSEISTSLLYVDPSISLKIYPNPAHKRIFIESTADLQKRILIYNLHGQLMNSQPLGGLKTSIDISTYPNGLYLLAVEADRKIIHLTRIEKIK